MRRFLFSFWDNGFSSRYILQTSRHQAWQNIHEWSGTILPGKTDFTCAAFGTSREAWILAGDEYKDSSFGVFRVEYGRGLPGGLRGWIHDEEKRLRRDRELRVVLGPDDGYVAWDSNSVKWSNIPVGLERSLEERCNETGWLSGPPKIIALGGNGAYFAQFDQEEPLIPEGWDTGLWGLLREEYLTNSGSSPIKHVALHPIDPTKFLLLRENATLEYDLPNSCLTPDFYMAIASIKNLESKVVHQERIGAIDKEATRDREEVLQIREDELIKKEEAFEEREQALTRKEETIKLWSDVTKRREEALKTREEELSNDEEALESRTRTLKKRAESIKRREEELRRKEEATRQRKEEKMTRRREENERYELADVFSRWKKEYDYRFSGQVPMTVFPSLPRKVCICNEAACLEHKSQEGALMACRHDLERFLRASGYYSLDWLKKESFRWHPDRFGMRCDPDYRVGLCKKAAQMFAMFRDMIEAEQNRRS